MYPNYTLRELRQAESDAVLFESVGLHWLSEVSARKANRLRASNKASLRRHKQAIASNRLAASA